MPDDARIEGLDMLRGIAVIGILAMNVASFALPPAAYGYPAVTRPPTLADVAAWAIGLVLVDGKMRALFSMLFGASLLLVADRAEAAGRSAARVHLARMAALLAIGLAHMLLVWSGDILTLYALVGTAAFAFRRLGVAELAVAGLLCVAGQAIVLANDLAALAALREAAAAPHAPPAIAAAWRTAAGLIGPGDGTATRAAIAVARGGYAGILADRIAKAPGALREQIEIVGPETLGYMLLGMALLRAGAATRWPPARLARAGALLAIPALVGELALLLLCFARGLDPLVVYGAETLGGAPLRPALALGYAALALAAAGRPGVPRRVAAAGRTALSNYVSASLICTTLCYGYGLGLYARLPRAALVGIVVPLAALMLLWSAAWLARFRLGPLEWLWRSLANGRMQAMRKKGIAIKSQ